MINHVDALLPAAPAAPCVLLGLEHEVPLLALAGDTYRGQTVFVRINPYSGDICGIKYTLSPKGVLREVPKKLDV
ncbi:hypothetical protein D8L93_09400, partial [Sodalis-like symbiont of Bactericera trigonica]